MKKLILANIGLAMVWLALVHMRHAAALEGYVQGCRDTIDDAFKTQGGEPIDQDANARYCEDLSKKYTRK